MMWMSFHEVDTARHDVIMLQAAHSKASTGEVEQVWMKGFATEERDENQPYCC